MSIKSKITLLKRWLYILIGKNRVAVKQGIGKVYSLNEIKGYYNDLTGKVNAETFVDEKDIPINVIEGGKKVYFPISIFQYALGLYDLYLINNDEEKKIHFLKLSNWALENQYSDGSWNCFEAIGYRKMKVSAMGQGEGISVLARAFQLTGEKKWLFAMEKAVSFMITEIQQGGTLLIDGENFILEEYPNLDGDKKSVLNGWIFALFGLYDYIKLNPNEQVQDIFDKSVKTLVKNINQYDTKYWSFYDQCGRLASPAYHDLHISLLKVLYEITREEEFKEVAKLWEKYSHNRLYKIKAILVKIIQKLGDSPEGIVIK